LDLRQTPVLKRLIPAVIRMVYGWRVRGQWAVARRDGQVWLVTPRNHVDRRHLEPGGHERLQRAQLFALLRKQPPELFLDIGANFGLYALAVAARFDCPVWAFEPDPRNFMQLGANILINGREGRVLPWQRAVAARSGRLALIRASERSTGQTRTAAAGPSDTSTVEAVAIDDLDLPPSSCIAAKIDVEGGEADVIAGMVRLLARAQGVIQIEILPGSGTSALDRLTSLGYREVARIAHDHFLIKP